jgi:hypothetical protein
MDFVEQLFGIAPDAGSGVLEYCLITVPLVLVLGAVFKHLINHHGACINPFESAWRSSSTKDIGLSSKS